MNPELIKLAAFCALEHSHYEYNEEYPPSKAEMRRAMKRAVRQFLKLSLTLKGLATEVPTSNV